jgi:pyruvate dehydrogenase E1 component alpha subunit
MALTKKQKKLLFTNLIRSHLFDEMVSKRMVSGRLVGFYHPGDGHLAPGVAAASFLQKSDYLSPHHRAHGMPHMLSKGIDMKYYIAEHTGKETGCCAGRSSFHFCFPEHGVFLMSGFIGYNFAPVVGLGWAAKQRGNQQVVMNCSGDGSYNEGRAHEALLMAANWRLPVVFFCENNGMAIFADANEMHPTPHISSMAKAYDMPSEIVDGQDVFASAEAALKAIKRAREGKGPTFIEAKTIRFREHDIGTPDLLGSAPRTKKQIDQLRARDPVEIATRHVREKGIFSEDEIAAIYEAAQAEVEAAEKFADDSPIPDVTEADLMKQVFYNGADV